MSMLRWDDTPRYEQGFKVGSEGDDGSHMRSTDGWPYSVYRMAAEAGATDVVICHGIQSLKDAREICERLQGLS